MENREALEREISLKEVFWNVLFGWRKIICLAVIFGVLLGGFRYAKDWGEYQKAQKTEEKTEIALSDKELTAVENIRILQQQLADYQEYLDTSLLMQMDPYKTPILELQYYIKSDYVIDYTGQNPADYTEALGGMYYRYISSGEMRKELIEQAGLSVTSEELEELVDVTQGSGVFGISVKYPQEELGGISEALKKLFSEKEKEFQKIGSHQLVLMGESQNTIVDDAAIEKKNTILTRMVTFNVQLNSLEAALTAQQKNVLNSQSEETETTAVAPKPQFSKKYVVLGAFVGIFLAGIWIICQVLFTGKLQQPEEIRNMYGVRLLGEIQTENKKKKFLFVIDKILLSLKNRRRKKLSLEQQVNVACTNIVLSCRQQQADCIYLTGSEYERADASVIQMVKKKLEEQHIQVKTGANMCYDAVSMEQGMEIGNILLIEQTGTSFYEEIQKEVHLIQEQKGNVLGVIVTE